MLKVKRERIYAGLNKGCFHYVATIQGRQIATGPTKDEATVNAMNWLLGAYECQTSPIYSSVTEDGSILTMREYEPGFVEYSFHRGPEGDRIPSGVCMGGCKINGKTVSVREYHRHVLNSYNEATRAAA